MSYKKIKSFGELARVDKPIGIYLLLWPSLLGFLLAGTQNILNIKDFMIVVIGSLIVRSCGCVINDISDYKIDKLVSRTAGRPLATGALTIFEAWMFFIVLGLLSILLLLLTNSLTFKIATFFAFLICIYPITKRFFSAPQFILGITFGSGVLIGYSLITSQITFSVIILYLGVIAWIISFDTYYALEDIEDDKKIGINSTAILWFDKAIMISRILHLLFYAAILMIAIINSFSYYFVVFFLSIFIVFVYQKKLIKNKDFIGAFKINNLIGILTVLGFAFEIIIIG